MTTETTLALGKVAAEWRMLEAALNVPRTADVVPITALACTRRQ